MSKFKSMNYILVECEGCRAKTSIEPGTEFSKLNCNCKPEKPKLNDTEISKPIQQELDYVKTQTVTVIGRFKDGDYEVCNGNDLSDTWRVPKDTFESTYEVVEIPLPVINETPKGITDEILETVTDGKENNVPEDILSLEDIKGMTAEEIASIYNIEALRALGKAVGFRNTGQTGQTKLIGKLLKKAE